MQPDDFKKTWKRALALQIAERWDSIEPAGMVCGFFSSEQTEDMPRRRSQNAKKESPASPI